MSTNAFKTMKPSPVMLSLFILAMVAAPLVLGAEKQPTADEQTEAGFIKECVLIGT